MIRAGFTYAKQQVSITISDPGGKLTYVYVEDVVPPECEETRAERNLRLNRNRARKNAALKKARASQASARPPAANDDVVLNGNPFAALSGDDAAAAVAAQLLQQQPKTTKEVSRKRKLQQNPTAAADRAQQLKNGEANRAQKLQTDPKAAAHRRQQLKNGQTNYAATLGKDMEASKRRMEVLKEGNRKRNELDRADPTRKAKREAQKEKCKQCVPRRRMPPPRPVVGTGQRGLCHVHGGARVAPCDPLPAQLKRAPPWASCRACEAATEQKTIHPGQFATQLQRSVAEAHQNQTAETMAGTRHERCMRAVHRFQDALLRIENEAWCVCFKHGQLVGG